MAGLDGLKNAHAYLGELGPLREVLAELQPLLGRIGDPDQQQWAMFESAFPAIGAADGRPPRSASAPPSRSVDAAATRCPESWLTAHLGWVARQRGQVDGRWPPAAGRWRWPPAPSMAGTPAPEPLPAGRHAAELGRKAEACGC